MQTISTRSVTRLPVRQVDGEIPWHTINASRQTTAILLRLLGLLRRAGWMKAGSIGERGIAAAVRNVSRRAASAGYRALPLGHRVIREEAEDSGAVEIVWEPGAREALALDAARRPSGTEPDAGQEVSR